MRQIADCEIDLRDAGPAIYGALADITAWIDAKPHEHRRISRPLLEDIAREIVTCEHRRDEMRGFGNAIVPASPDPLPAAPLPVPVPMPPAPVPAPAIGAEPCVASVPARGVSLARIWGTWGMTDFCASTGVASLLMFGGAAAPSFSFGLGSCFCFGVGGGGGGD